MPCPGLCMSIHCFLAKLLSLMQTEASKVLLVCLVCSYSNVFSKTAFSLMQQLVIVCAYALSLSSSTKDPPHSQCYVWTLYQFIVCYSTVFSRAASSLMQQLVPVCAYACSLSSTVPQKFSTLFSAVCVHSDPLPIQLTIHA